MSRPAPESPEGSAETLHALAVQCIDRLRRIENHSAYHFLEFWLSHRLHIELLSWPGRLIAVVFHFCMLLLPALLLAAITDQWASMPLVTWTIVAAGYGVVMSLAPLLYWSSIGNHLSWVMTIADEADLRRYAKWQFRWFNHRVSVPISAALTLAVFLPLYYLTYYRPGVPVQAGALYCIALIGLIFAQNIYGVIMMAPEAYVVSSCKHDLYPLSPADSIPVRQSLRGYSQTGVVTALNFTVLILLLVPLLPGGSNLIAPIIVALLLVEYLCCGVAVVVPRLMIQRLIRARKEEDMQILQRQLKDRLPRVGQMTEEESEEMTQIQEVYDAIRDSPENLLPLGAIAKIVGALLLSTFTVLATTFAQEWLAELAKRLLP